MEVKHVKLASTILRVLQQAPASQHVNAVLVTQVMQLLNVCLAYLGSIRCQSDPKDAMIAQLTRMELECHQM